MAFFSTYQSHEIEYLTQANTKLVESTNPEGQVDPITVSSLAKTNYENIGNLPNQHTQITASLNDHKIINFQRLEQKYGTTREEHDKYVAESLASREKNREIHEATLKKFKESIHPNQNSSKLPPPPF